MANSEPESGPYTPPPCEFVRFEDGCTTVQFRGLVSFEWIAPKVQFWGSIAARFTAAPLDELADGWVTAAREIVQAAPPSFDCPRDAKAQEQLARRGEPLQPEMILLPGLGREILELEREAREQSEAPQEPPALPSPFGARDYGESMTLENALRWLRLAVQLMEARGQFSHEHHLVAAELAGLVVVEFQHFDQWEKAPILAAGRGYLARRKKAWAPKIERDAGICKRAAALRDSGMKREVAVFRLSDEFGLGTRTVEAILQAGGVRWRKPPE